MAYLKKLVDTASRVLCRLVLEIEVWAELHSDAFSEIHSREEERLGRSQEWSLLPPVFSAIREVISHPLIDSLATRANTKLLLYVTPILNLLAWTQDAFHHPWDDLGAYTFPPFTLPRQVLLRVIFLAVLSLVLIAPLWPQNEWFTDLLALLVEEPVKIPS